MYGYGHVCMAINVCYSHVWLQPFMVTAMYGHVYMVTAMYVWLLPCMYGYSHVCMVTAMYGWLRPCMYGTAMYGTAMYGYSHVCMVRTMYV